MLFRRLNEAKQYTARSHEALTHALMKQSLIQECSELLGDSTEQSFMSYDSEGNEVVVVICSTRPGVIVHVEACEIFLSDDDDQRVYVEYNIPYKNSSLARREYVCDDDDLCDMTRLEMVRARVSVLLHKNDRKESQVYRELTLLLKSESDELSDILAQARPTLLEQDN